MRSKGTTLYYMNSPIKKFYNFSKNLSKKPFFVVYIMGRTFSKNIVLYIIDRRDFMDLLEIILIAGIGFALMKIFNYIKNNKDRFKNKNPFK